MIAHNIITIVDLQFIIGSMTSGDTMTFEIRTGSCEPSMKVLKLKLGRLHISVVMLIIPILACRKWFILRSPSQNDAACKLQSRKKNNSGGTLASACV